MSRRRTVRSWPAEDILDAFLMGVLITGMTTCVILCVYCMVMFAVSIT